MTFIVTSTARESENVSGRDSVDVNEAFAASAALTRLMSTPDACNVLALTEHPFLVMEMTGLMASDSPVTTFDDGVPAVGCEDSPSLIPSCKTTWSGLRRPGGVGAHRRLTRWPDAVVTKLAKPAMTRSGIPALDY